MLSNVLAAYNLHGPRTIVSPFGSGLINNTWKITCGNDDFILQRVNHNVFIHPENIAENIRHMGRYLQENHPGYLYTLPLKTVSGEDLFFDENRGYFRVFPFIKKSHTINVVEDAGQAREAAAEFGKFTKMLSGFPVSKLKLTIPNFHNLSLRYTSFLKSLKTGDKQRIAECNDVIEEIDGNKHLVAEYELITQHADFKIRVTHHDTKISNVLFDEHQKGLCVIDLDTVMPGYFISDVGDMMRTYLSPVSEEEQDLSRIEVRDDFFVAIVKGYGSQMKDELTETEKKFFVYAGKFMIYMQALRFITDYFNNDVYYSTKYPAHNLSRARNQLVLLQKLSAKKHLEDVTV